MATGDKLVTLDGMKALKDALYTEPAIFEIAPAQWSGTSGDWYFTVSASNVTEDSILIPQYDVDSAALLNGPIWCVPDDGEFTIHTTAIPGGTVNIMVLFPGTKGVAQVQVLPDAYTTDQVDDMFDNVYTKSEVYTKTETNSAISQSTANIKIINQGTVNLGQVAPKTRGAVTVTFATPFTNTNYSVVATFAAGSQGFAYAIPQIQSKTTTTVSIGVWNNDANATATVSALDWVAVGT